jgi:hypothetical protein
MVVDSLCVSSLNYPANYADSSNCFVTGQEAGWFIDVVSFETERNYDYLYLNGQQNNRFHGNSETDPDSYNYGGGGGGGGGGGYYNYNGGG